MRRSAEKAAAQSGARLADELAARATPLAGVRVLFAEARGVEAKGLRGLWDALAKGGVEVALLVGEAADKAPVLVGASPSAIARGVQAGDLLKTSTAVLGGGGGGKADLAQGQGLDRAKIPEALAAVRARVEAVLGR